jgi:hypothetical protein
MSSVINRMLEPRRAFLLSTVFTALCACGSEAPSAVTIGRAIGHDTRLAVIEIDGRTLAYVCGGPSSYATHSRWFRGASTDGVLESEGWRLRLHGERPTLETPSSGPSIEFESNAPVREDSMAGLYATMDRGCRTGVIVSEDEGGTPAIQGTWCDESGNFEQVEPAFYAPNADQNVLRSGFEVEVLRPDGPAILQVRPAAP